MASYRLSQKADEDFENIFDYGIDTFGLDQAIAYQQGMEMQFDIIAQNPMLYTAVDNIKKGHRRSVFGSHSIYYKVEKGFIVIVRILGMQDPTFSLPD